MQIHLIAVGSKMPEWVTEGFDEFSKRLPGECSLKLVEIPAGKRGKNADIVRLTREEGERTLAAIPKGSLVVALDVKGRPWSTEQLSQQLKGWLEGGRDVALMIGGPEGLADSCRARADALWSLSPLTFPHPLVRIVVAEQLYRAWSILQNHPYHR